ncbi:MAG: arginine decarboxylase, pyruvoyl-dependent [Methanosphaera sp.]|nr:arginine decarboxylase, pyruvoyl-dependent [Methanosphaera sp.]
MNISLTKGASEGPTKLNAFDNALLEADIGDVNLIPVSSMLPPDTHIIPMPQLKPGEMTNCVLAQEYSDNPGDEITAIIALARADQMGCVVELSGTNRDLDEMRQEAKFMAEYMIHKRKLKINDYHEVVSTHTVIDKASVVAALVYHDPIRH